MISAFELCARIYVVSGFWGRGVNIVTGYGLMLSGREDDSHVSASFLLLVMKSYKMLVPH